MPLVPQLSKLRREKKYLVCFLNEQKLSSVTATRRYQRQEEVGNERGRGGPSATSYLFTVQREVFIFSRYPIGPVRSSPIHWISDYECMERGFSLRSGCNSIEWHLPIHSKSVSQLVRRPSVTASLSLNCPDCQRTFAKCLNLPSIMVECGTYPTRPYLTLPYLTSLTTHKVPTYHGTMAPWEREFGARFIPPLHGVTFTLGWTGREAKLPT